jgi:protein-S-isoprenylcysteine O-methyltransferase Ste14
MKKELLGQALIKFASGVALVMLLTFLPAGTFSYWQAWLLCGVLFIPMLAAGIVMLQKAPDLLAKRLNLKERQGEQKTVVALSGLLFIVMFVLAGLGRRFGWFMLPPAVSWIAAVVFLLGYALFAEVLRENAYLSRTVEVQKGQTVIDTGLYGIVRHPMYSATLLLFLSMPLILGSLFSFLVMLGYVPVIVLRIRNEESVLTEGLPGYADYKTRIKYRLIPFIW